MATIVGEVTGLQQCNHPWNIPHLVKKIRGFPLKVKLFQNTATYPNSWEGLHPPPPPPTPLYLGGGMNLRLHPRVNYCGNERRKMPFYNLQEDGTSRPRSFVSIIVLTICFSSLHFFFTFCYLSWATHCDFTFSDYYESILFHVGSSAFEISTKLVVIGAKWWGQKIYAIVR